MSEEEYIDDLDYTAGLEKHNLKLIKENVQLQQENKHLNLQLDQALKDYLNKEKQKKYLELFMILDEIAKKEDIISFIYTKDLLTVQIGINDYYRIWINEEVN